MPPEIFWHVVLAVDVPQTGQFAFLREAARTAGHLEPHARALVDRRLHIGPHTVGIPLVVRCAELARVDRRVAPRAVARADHCVANQVGRRVRDPEASRRVVVFRAVLAIFVGPVGVVARVRRVVGHHLGRQQRDDEVGA
eukprot:scaffold87883_cov63-Phaeocystis_antarctica.AAC.3